ncbi:carbohydrate ABC transporter permease [Microbacterium foliorum]|uniref:carbohydrate ABC transporter permease n=1 Tax=Microbacterium foliorum TaxID=104336 RepID=UPI0009A09291|nr:carbohydrate ABC transporter permease [Microbacterium foliorum]AQY02368.1 sugar ABC transporter permease [Microbacterium foliorum]
MSAGYAFKPDKTKPKSFSLTVVVLLLVAYFLLPLVWLLIASTKSNADLFTTFGFAFGDFNLWQNIVDVVSYDHGRFLTWARNSLLYSGTAALGATMLATAAGYALAKYDFPGKKFMFASVLAAVMVPTTALAIPTYFLFAQVGLTNTPWAVILPSMISPFGLYLMRVYAQSAVPTELIEAGRIDGASDLRVFFSIGLRLLVPGTVTVFLFTLVATWNNYLLPLIMLNSPDLFPLTVGLAQWQSAAAGGTTGESLFSIVITGSMLSVMPLIAIFLYLQRFWQSGLGVGGVKG